MKETVNVTRSYTYTCEVCGEKFCDMEYPNAESKCKSHEAECYIKNGRPTLYSSIKNEFYTRDLSFDIARVTIMGIDVSLDIFFTKARRLPHDVLLNKIKIYHVDGWSITRYVDVKGFTTIIRWGTTMPKETWTESHTPQAKETNVKTLFDEAVEALAKYDKTFDDLIGVEAGGFRRQLTTRTFIKMAKDVKLTDEILPHIIEPIILYGIEWNLERNTSFLVNDERWDFSSKIHAPFEDDPEFGSLVVSYGEVPHE